MKLLGIPIQISWIISIKAKNCIILIIKEAYFPSMLTFGWNEVERYTTDSTNRVYHLHYSIWRKNMMTVRHRTGTVLLGRKQKNPISLSKNKSTSIVRQWDEISIRMVYGTERILLYSTAQYCTKLNTLERLSPFFLIFWKTKKIILSSCIYVHSNV